jgi:hypothetical protein
MRGEEGAKRRVRLWGVSPVEVIQAELWKRLNGVYT